MLISMPIAMPTSITPTKSWMAAFGVPSTKMAEKRRPNRMPLMAPERAAAAYPSRPVTVSTDRSPRPTIAMSFAGISAAMRRDTVFWAPSYDEYSAIVSPCSCGVPPIMLTFSILSCPAPE